MTQVNKAPEYNTPHVVAKPHETYFGSNQKIIDEINQKESVNLGDKTLTKHINSPGALIPDSRYVENTALDDARKGAEKWTKKIAEANGSEIAKEVKEEYAAAMANLRNVHHEILPKLPFDADQRTRNDIEKVIEKTAHVLGKKVAVVAGFLASSASFAGEAIDVSGKIIEGRDFNTDNLKTLGRGVVDKGVEGAAGVVDPLGLIDTKEITDQLVNGNLAGAGAAFNQERLKVASEIADFALEHTR